MVETDTMIPFIEERTSLKRETLTKLAKINFAQFRLAQATQDLEDLLMTIESEDKISKYNCNH